MLAAAFIVSSALAGYQAKKEGVDADAVFNFLFIVFVSGVIGARIFYIVENISYYFKNPLEIIMVHHGGLSWFGGLILGSICGVVYLKRKNLAVYKILDLIIPFVALGQAVGRIGCLLNGCCFGKESLHCGIYFPVYKTFLIPVQVYSSLLLLLIFIVLRFLQDRPHRIGEVFFAYLFLYSVKRFFIEFLRADNAAVLYGLTLFQLLSIGIFALSVIKIVLIKKKPG